MVGVMLKRDFICHWFWGLWRIGLFNTHPCSYTVFLFFLLLLLFFVYYSSFAIHQRNQSCIMRVYIHSCWDTCDFGTVHAVFPTVTLLSKVPMTVNDCS